jgi:hypothetical protein
MRKIRAIGGSVTLPASKVLGQLSRGGLRAFVDIDGEGK